MSRRTFEVWECDVEGCGARTEAKTTDYVRPDGWVHLVVDSTGFVLCPHHGGAVVAAVQYHKRQEEKTP